MRQHFSRREFLVSSLGTAGVLATSGLLRAETSEKVYYPSVKLPAVLPVAPVAIERCRSYDPATLREKLDAALNLIGGLKKLVGNKTVSIKVNVTGGPGKLAGLPGFRTYQIHPNVLAALCAALNDAGARRMIVLESQYSLKAPEELLADSGWDVRAIQSAGGNRVSFQDTRHRGKWPQYSRLKVPWGGFLFPAFDVNACYEKTDVFISLAKLKDHLSTGLTLSIKNLFGMTPTSLYGHDDSSENSQSNRGAVLHNGTIAVPAGVPKEIGEHVPREWKYRVPRVTADCLGAAHRPGSDRRHRNRPRRRGPVGRQGPADPTGTTVGWPPSALHRRRLPRPQWATTRWPIIFSSPSPAKTTCGCCVAWALARSIPSGSRSAVCRSRRRSARSIPSMRRSRRPPRTTRTTIHD